MIPLSIQIILALSLDYLIGDPRWLPHPVKAIGRLALAIEMPLRRHFSLRLAGIIAVAIVVLSSSGLTWISCRLATSIHPLLGDLIAILFMATGFAMQDLRRHALAVYQPLAKNDLPQARAKVAMLVGRDTDNLSEAEIGRATIESVAENTVDGVTAPLFFACLAGAPGVILYKAINTLDSTYGYKNERYLQFGWAAAKLDDVANFLPARISALFVPIAARLTKLNSKQAWQIFRRDRHNHPSPNGGQIEAAFAGGLNIQLGGEISYGGKMSFRPLMGDPNEKINAEKILNAIRLMVVTSVCFAIIGLLLHLATT